MRSRFKSSLSVPNLKPLALPSTHFDFNSAESRIGVSPLLDTSGSMIRVAQQVHESVNQMIESLRETPSIARRVDMQLTTAGGTAEVHGPFQCVLRTECPTFQIGGGTPLSEASILALDSLKEWKTHLRRHETELVSSIVVIISDGEATDKDKIATAKQALRDAQDSISIIPFLTDGGNRSALEDFCGCRALAVSEIDIAALFRKLTAVIRTVSMASPRQIEGPSFVRNLMFGGDDAI
jgi:uncharacterized protein YegL